MSKTKNSTITSFFTSTSQSKQNQNQIIIIEDQIDDHHHPSNPITSSSSHSKLNSSQTTHQINTLSKVPTISKTTSHQQVSNTHSNEDEDEDDEIQFISMSTLSESKPIKPIKPEPKKTKPNSTFLTFAELDAIRKSKQTSKLIPTEANWPTDDLIHNREPYRSDSSNNLIRSSNPSLRLRKGKSKTKTRSNEEFIFDQIKEPKPIPSIQLPTLKRLDLIPPTQLLSDLNSNPIYQTPLISRLLQLLEPANLRMLLWATEARLEQVPTPAQFTAPMEKARNQRLIPRLPHPQAP